MTKQIYCFCCRSLDAFHVRFVAVILPRNQLFEDTFVQCILKKRNINAHYVVKLSARLVICGATYFLCTKDHQRKWFKLQLQVGPAHHLHYEIVQFHMPWCFESLKSCLSWGLYWCYKQCRQTVQRSQNSRQRKTFMCSPDMFNHT